MAHVIICFGGVMIIPGIAVIAVAFAAVRHMIGRVFH